MKVVRSEYAVENNRPVVYFFCRNADGSRSVVKSQKSVPYFYILAEEVSKVLSSKVDPNDFTSVTDEKLKKVYTNLPEDVPKIRDYFSRTWEADVVYPTRTLIDEIDVIDPTIPKVLFIDIEVDSFGRIPDVRLAEEQVIAITAYDSLSSIYTTFAQRGDLSEGVTHSQLDGCLHEVRYYRSERQMLQEFLNYFSEQETDIVTGWNVVYFDMTYLLNRMTRLGINISKFSPMGSCYFREAYTAMGQQRQDIVIKGVALLDLMDLYRRFSENQEVSYTLDYIGQKIAGKGKIESGSNVRWLWKNHLDRLIAYNANDIVISVAIDKKMRLIEFIDELRRTSFCQYEDCMTTGRMADAYILKLFHGKKIFPTKIKHEERESFEGAFVGSWAKGIYSNVVGFDLKSLYPSILVSLNLSPESVIENDVDLRYPHVTVDGISFRQDIRGFLPEVVRHLFTERARYKGLMKTVTLDSPEHQMYDMRQRAIKVLLNSLYGQTAFPHSRIYSPMIAKTITYMGRRVNQFTREMLDSWNFTVLYSDTDSCYFQIDEVSIPYIERVNKLLNESYDKFMQQWGVQKHILQIEFEKVYRRFFAGTARKRYAGWVVYKEGREANELDVKGFEIRRSDSSQFSRNLQKNVFDMLLRRDCTKDEVVRYIASEIDRIRKGSFKFVEIGLPKGIQKDLSEYGKRTVSDGKVSIKGVPANIRSAKYAVDVLKIQLTTKPKMLYILKMPEGYPPTDVLAFDEETQVPPGTEIDADKTLEKLVKDKLDSIFEALDWSMNEVLWYWKGLPPPQGQQNALFEVQDAGKKVSLLPEIQEQR